MKLLLELFYFVLFTLRIGIITSFMLSCVNNKFIRTSSNSIYSDKKGKNSLGSDVKFDFDSKDVRDEFEYKSNEMKVFKEYGNLGLQLFKSHDIQGAITAFQQAAAANSSQPLTQLGICYYCEERFSEAVKQLSKDIKLIESSKQFKASDLRLWLSASYNRLGKPDDAYYALDLKNINCGPGIFEKRMLMNNTLNFYGSSNSAMDTVNNKSSTTFTLDDMLDYIGKADENDFEGRRFYGNFYLGLYFDSINSSELSEVFLQYPQESRKYRSHDMWFHLPKVLYNKRFKNKEIVA